MHILIVDDDEATREVLTESLRMAGHLTAACASGEAAMPMLPYVDAVVCDGLYGRCWDVLDEAARQGKAGVLYTGDDVLAAEARWRGVPVAVKPAGVEAIVAALQPQAVSA